MALPCHRSIQAIAQTLHPTLHNPTAYVHRVYLASLPHTSRTSCRTYATHTGLDTTPEHSRTRRKSITLTGDDGRVPWGDLSPAEKVIRTTQQSFNFTIILVGAVAAVGVTYILWTHTLSPSSTTSHFSRAVDRVRAHPDSIALLGGPGGKIEAFGDGPFNWRGMARNRPIASQQHADPDGTEHVRMHFNVAGSQRQGVVTVHLVRGKGTAERWEYRYLALNVKGEETLVLVKEEEKGVVRKGFSLLGIRFK